MPGRTSRQLIMLAAALSFVGCKTPAMLTKHLPWTDEKKIVESKYDKPARLVVIWTAAILSEAGKPPTRGFGGRIYFYNAENKAIPVDGQLVVYGYDENRVSADTRTPDRRFAFTPEQFKKHFAETDLGASYSVWVPWEAVGGPNMEIGLLPIFTSTSGQVVVGQQSKNNLPGNDPNPKPQPTMQPSLSKLDPYSASASASAGNRVQPASYQATDAWPNFASREGVRVETIPLTPQTAQRLAASDPAGNVTTVVPNNLAMPAVPPIAVPLPQPTLPPAPATTAGPGSIPPPWSPPDPRSTRYARPQSQAPSLQSASPSPDRTHWPPGLSVPPSPLPSGPQSVTLPATPAGSQNASSAAR